MCRHSYDSSSSILFRLNDKKNEQIKKISIFYQKKKKRIRVEFEFEFELT